MYQSPFYSYPTSIANIPNRCLGLSRPSGPENGDDTTGKAGKGGHYSGKGNWNKGHQGVKGYHQYNEHSPRYEGKGHWGHED